MKAATRFTLIVFGPLVAVLFIPAPFVVCNCVMCVQLLLLAVVAPEPDLTLSSTASYCMWTVAPFVAAATILVLGGLCRFLYSRWRSPRALWIMAWAVFSVSLFAIAWLLTVMLGSVSMAAADSTGYSFLFVCAGAAGAITLAGQLLVIPWLFVASLIMKRLDPALAGNEGLLPVGHMDPPQAPAV
jgi:hypothetical protein